MAFYSINSNLPGVKKVLISEPVPVVGSSTLIPAFVVALDADDMQDSLDGYVVCEANTDTSQVVFATPVDLDANEIAGHWIWVNFPSPEVRQIVSNTAADVGSNVTVTVALPFSSAPTSGTSANVRLWEDFNIPSLHSSLSGFAEKFIDKSVAGAYQWNDSANAFYTINEFKSNGGSLFYIIPVPYNSDATLMAEAFVNAASNSTFAQRMLNLSPQPALVCVPKQPSLPSLSVSQWASVDGAWEDYVTNRATDDTIDDELRELFLVADTPSSATATAVTYRTTTLNATSERMELCHGQYLTQSVDAGQVQVVAPSPARCGVINRVSTQAPESWGHAFEGANYTQVGILQLVEDLTPANRLSLIANGINPLITKPGRGAWFESSHTQAKAPSDVGADPIEHMHVVVGRAQIWNTLQPILNSVLAEPNNAVTRQAVLSQIDGVMAQINAKGLIAGYTLNDITNDVDVGSGTARFELSVLFNREIDFVELTLSARVGQ